MARGGVSILYDMFDLCQQLKQEQLFIDKEREHLQKIYEEVRQVAMDLYHTAWIARQQKHNLHHMLARGTGVKRDDLCARHNEMENITFVDSYKQLSYHDMKYGELLKFIRENPVLVAQCILVNEKTDNSNMSKYINILLASVYGSCILAEDEANVLQILRVLIDSQLTPDRSPLRLLRKGSCAFSICFKQFSDSIFSTRLFLTAVLHDPIMRLLMEDEWFYDIDPDKALVRFPPKEQLKRFGEPGSDGYAKKLENYRKFVVDKLVLLSSRFVNSIKGNIHCFPASLTWLISHVYHSLVKAGHVSMVEVRATCADLVFSQFICPAICDPEPYGITTDVPISHIAQHNLMQMAKIVQVLAVSAYAEIDEKVRDIYGRFEKGCMSSFIDNLIQSCVDEVPSVGNNQAPAVDRSGVLITTRQLNELMGFLRLATSQMDENTPGYTILEKMLSSIPNIISTTPSGEDGKTLTPGHTPNTTPPGTPSSQKKLTKGLKKKHSNANLASLQIPESGVAPSDGTDSPNLPGTEDVLVISLGTATDCPGMMTENKVLSLDQESRKRRVKYQTPAEDNVVTPGVVVEIQEKRTRFSLSHDQESIGNTSDYQEVISEAASSHSVDNDMDQDLEENDNDNLSDMMSANVSGRGSPSISGRDTPLSQAGSVEERNNTELSVRVPVTVRKQNREDVTDRFGKFEIKTEFERDETKSTVSDTWSTDVLASDSEPPEQNQLERLVEVVEDMGMPNLVPTDDTDSTFPPSEISETASDAWSTDVLASDTEEKQSELTDLDQDDLVSMTGRSEIEELDLTGNEETPQASDGPSPPSDLDLVDLGAVGGQGPGNDSSTHNKSNNRQDEIGMSDIVYNLNKLEVKKVMPSSMRGHPQDSQVQAANVINDLENKNDSDDVFVPIDSPANFGARPKEYHRRGNKTQMKNSDVALWARTNGINSLGGQELVSGGAGVVAPTNPGISRPAVKPKQLNVTNTNAPAPSDLLIDLNEITTTSQTNTTATSAEENFDERRLSAALSLFDPLSMDNSSSDILGDGLGSHNFQTGNISHNAPLLRVSEPSQDMDTGSLPVMIKSDDTIQENDPISGQNSLDDPSPLKRRDSSDSNQSASSLRLNEGGASKEASGDTMSIRSDDKDFDIESKSDKGFKKASIFKSLKEKITTIKKRATKVESQLLPNGSPGASDRNQNNDSPAPEENVDDILDKYRKKNPEEVASGNEDLLSNQHKIEGPSLSKDEEDGPPFYDANNLENCFAFQDAKRKLRLVLSVGDFHTLGNFNASRDDPRQENELISLLRSQLAEAINLQNKGVVAQLHEVIRCVRLFDSDGIRKLIKSLREDYRNRSVYISYLVRCRQGLLFNLSHLQRLLLRTRREKDIGIKHLVNMCTKLFLESYDRRIVEFYNDFQKLNMADEKTDSVERFLERMYRQMEQDAIWTAATEEQMEDGRLAIERSIMSRIYSYALFPNGDGDISRDQVFHQYIKGLSQCIKPTHPKLCIPRVYHFECPWPAAQREIFMINAYKTPKDKLGCVVRCSMTIMNLLSMANEKSVPAADDFFPVLIYVIIRANPPCLLSTIQYVQSFYDNRLAGEESYWWSQFSSAVEFIKNME